MVPEKTGQQTFSLVNEFGVNFGTISCTLEKLTDRLHLLGWSLLSAEYKENMSVLHVKCTKRSVYANSYYIPNPDIYSELQALELQSNALMSTR